MKKFLFLFRGGAFTKKDLSPETLQAHFAKWGEWSAQLDKDGRIEGGNPLENTGRTVRGSGKTVTDGPYAEAKDLLTGYIMINAKDLDDATEVARTCPIYAYDGSVEIRPLRPLGR
jgi:hypothetical protein